MEKTKNMSWYIIRAAGNKEKSVSQRIINESLNGDLMEKVGQVLVPTENSFYMKNDKKVKREKVMFPGYIFVETNAIGELKYFLKNVNGASGFLTNRSGEILPLTKSEVSNMLGIQKENEEKEIDSSFIIGEDVKIVDGPFSSMIGTIENILGQKVKLSVSIFGRKTPIELNLLQIDKK